MASVLVVEDDDNLRATICRGFESRRHAVFSAATGEEAIEVGRRAKPAAAVIDLALPGLGGLGAFAALKTENRRLIGIAISGVFAASDGVRASREAGAAGFFANALTCRTSLTSIVQTFAELAFELSFSDPISSPAPVETPFRLIARMTYNTP